MDKILQELRVINGAYRLAYSHALKIDELQQKIETLLEDKKGDVKGYENALKKLKDKSSKGKKAEELIKDIKKMQKKSIISHYESKKQAENTTKKEE
tara:strand:- start:927 stop:1217 length:291 start_codon:yes stop_codon:yes gene_type:complete